MRAIGKALDGVRARCDTESRRNNDPVEFVHRYEGAADRELVALVASALAFGNVKALRAKIEDALGRLGPDLARTADDPAEVARRLRGWKHRVYRDEHLYPRPADEPQQRMPSSGSLTPKRSKSAYFCAIASSLR